MASGPVTSWQIEGEGQSSDRFPLLGSEVTAGGDCSHEIRRWVLLGRRTLTDVDSVLKSRDITLLTKVLIVLAMVFPVVMYNCESWTVKAECQRVHAFELWCWRRLLKFPWTTRRSVNLKRSQPWILVGRTDAEAEAPVFWSSDANSWLIGKDPDAGKDWGQKEKRESEDEMAGWHHQCNGHELRQTSGVPEGQRGLACCSPWGHKEFYTTGRLNNIYHKWNDNHKKSYLKSYCPMNWFSYLTFLSSSKVFKFPFGFLLYTSYLEVHFKTSKYKDF